MMQKVLFLLAFLLTAGSAEAQAVPQIVDEIQKSIDAVGDQDWNGPGSLIRKALNLLEGKKDTHPSRTLTVILANFTYGQTGLGSPFSRFLEDQFAAALVRSQYFSLFPRDVLSNLPAGIETAYRNQLGGASATGSLSGKFNPGPDGSVLVDYQLADLERGQVIGYGQIKVAAGQIPKNVTLEPPPLPTAPLAPPAPEAGLDALAVTLTTDRGQAGTYFDNEELRVSVFANKDCWLKLYLVDGQGNVKLIFPNAYSAGNQIAARTLVKIPDGTAGFAFKMGPPYGVETLRVLASTTPFQDTEPPFQNLGTDAAQVISRGLSVQAKGVAAELAQAQVQYTVQPTP